MPTIAASDDTDTLDAGMTSPLFTKESEVNPFCDSVHQQAEASCRPASLCVMHKGSCGKLQHSVNDHVMVNCVKLQRRAHVVRSCGKLQRSDCSDVEKLC